MSHRLPSASAVPLGAFRGSVLSWGPEGHVIDMNGLQVPAGEREKDKPSITADVLVYFNIEEYREADGKIALHAVNLIAVPGGGGVLNGGSAGDVTPSIPSVPGSSEQARSTTDDALGHDNLQPDASSAAEPPIAPPSKSKSKRRRTPPLEDVRRDSDGGMYTRQQFLEYYGGLDEWDACETRPIEPHGKFVVQKVFREQYGAAWEVEWERTLTDTRWGKRKYARERARAVKVKDANAQRQSSTESTLTPVPDASGERMAAKGSVDSSRREDSTDPPDLRSNGSRLTGSGGPPELVSSDSGERE